MPFSKLGLSDQLVQGILATGYTAPTSIQSRAIPIVISGRDIIGIAHTGTGKTAAFVLPMLNHFLKHPHSKGHHTRGLVLSPTRELAQQTQDFITGYGRFANFQSLAVFGGVSLDNQIKRLRRGADIVVATPGRLIDHINRRTVDLSGVEILVIDEADRMFDMGFINDVRKIIARIPAKRQTLLFSATISKEVKALVADVQHNPELIEIGEQRKPLDNVRQHFYSAQQEIKTDLLFHILRTQELDCVLVFSRTKHSADKISHKLERGGIKAVAIHSNRTQAQRQRAMAGFKQGQYKVMVATDIAARGIDVEGISHVINYDTPTFAEDYIHRIGRTGRASATGDAITFVSKQEHNYLKRIERFVGKSFELKRYPGYDYTKKASLTETNDGIKSSRERYKDKRVSRDRDRVHQQHEKERKPHSKQLNTESSEVQNRELGHKGSSRKPKGEAWSNNSFGKPRHSQRPSGFSGKARHEINSHDRREDNDRRHAHPTEKTQYVKKQSEPKPANPVEGTDWRSLVAEMDEGRGGLRKKLKRLFIRDKA
jgi:ATP-dependent RNA helicase RhlE